VAAWAGGSPASAARISYRRGNRAPITPAFGSPRGATRVRTSAKTNRDADGLSGRQTLAATLLQTVPIGHRDATHDRPHNADEPLVGAAEVEILEVGHPVELLLRGAVHGAIFVARVANDGAGGEHVGGNHPV